MPSLLTWDVNTEFESAGEGQPVIFIHGSTLDLRVWSPQWKVFSRVVRTIRYDMRGHGRSSSPKTGYPPDGYVMQLRTLLDGLRVSSSVLVAHSFGAAVAIDFALNFPSRVSALVLSNPEIWGAPIPAGSFYEGLSRPSFDPGPIVSPRAKREALEKWLSSGLFEATRKNEKAFRAIESVVYTHGCAPWQEDRRHKYPDDFSRLGEISAPTLVLYGEEEDPYFRECAAAAGEKIPGARLVGLAGSGHVAGLEKPEEFNRTVLDFLHDERFAEKLPPGAEKPPKHRKKKRAADRPGDVIEEEGDDWSLIPIEPPPEPAPAPRPTPTPERSEARPGGDRAPREGERRDGRRRETRGRGGPSEGQRQGGRGGESRRRDGRSDEQRRGGRGGESRRRDGGGRKEGDHRRPEGEGRKREDAGKRSGGGRDDRGRDRSRKDDRRPDSRRPDDRRPDDRRPDDRQPDDRQPDRSKKRRRPQRSGSPARPERTERRPEKKQEPEKKGWRRFFPFGRKKKEEEE